MAVLNNTNRLHSLAELQTIISSELDAISKEVSTDIWAIYTRLSREETRHHSYSLEIQPERAEEYARSKGAKKILLYSDPYLSGKNSHRANLQRLIKDIKEGKINVVCVHRLDRLFRNLESLLEFVRLCKRYHVRLVSVTEQIDTDTWWGRLVLYVLGALAEMYVVQTSERTREVKADRVRKHHLPNGTIPLGYCNGLCSDCRDPNGASYCPLFGKSDRDESQRGRIPVLHPVDQHAIALIVKLYKWDAMSFREIAEYLNSNDFVLTNGNRVHFRSKGVQGRESDHCFDRESIRTIISNPFYAGLVARYPRPPLDMEDNIENPDQVLKPKPPFPARTILELHEGVHKRIITVAEWQELQAIRKGKGATSTNSSKVKRVYPLSGIGRCWECLEHDGYNVGLLGSPAGQNAYYRCSHMHNRSMKRPLKDPVRLAEKTFVEIGIRVQPNADEKILRERHASLRADRLEPQVDAIMQALTISPDWYDTIMAYYLNDNGMTEFEREGHNLRQSLVRYQKLYRDSHIDQAEFDAQALHITRQLQVLKPTVRPEAQEILPLLKDFPSLWGKMTTAEKRRILSVLFEGLYFDRKGNLRKAAAYQPFGRMLGLS
jgi:DNA invertase Pin-like site-specific DNA recombinase